MRRLAGPGTVVVALLGLAALVVLVLAVLPRNRVRVLDVTRPKPGVVELMVASCNAAPKVDIIESTPGRYEVEAQTTVSWDRGEDCGDVVAIAVDPDVAEITIVDNVGDQEFGLPAEPPPAPIDIEGSWRLVSVDAQPVDIGNGAPVLIIDGGLARGKADCNQAVAELLLDETMLRRAGGITATEMGCGPPGPADLLWRQIWDVLGGDRGVDVRLEGDRMTWTGDAERLEFERV